MPLFGLFTRKDGPFGDFVVLADFPRKEEALDLLKNLASQVFFPILWGLTGVGQTFDAKTRLSGWQIDGILSTPTRTSWFKHQPWTGDLY